MRKLIAVLFILTPFSIFAEDPFFQASLTPEIAIHHADTRIRGIALSIWGENPQSAFALGFVNGSSGVSAGFSIGLANYSEHYTGVHWSFINYHKGEFTGWSDGFVNWSNTFTGLQSGWLNVAVDMTGCQLGVLNYTEKMHGVQIGLLNIIRDDPWFSEFPQKLAMVFPFVNWSF